MNTTPTRTRRRSRREIRRAATQQAEARANGTPQLASPSLDMEPPKRVRVAVYIRISTDEEHQPFSLEAQEINLRRYISTQPGWELACIYPDEKSGATLDRKQLQQALAAAAAGKFDILLVYRVDRLSRSLRGLVDILEQLETAGVAFRSATELVDTSTPVGKLLVQLLGLFAEFERAMIIDRVINGMERKAARGEWCGGTPPPGYDLDRDTGKLAPRPDEGPSRRRRWSCTSTTDRNADRALFRQLADLLRNQILTGELEPGTDLPPTSRLASEHGVGKDTVIAAFAILRAEGLIATERGRPAYVTERETKELTVRAGDRVEVRGGEVEIQRAGGATERYPVAHVVIRAE